MSARFSARTRVLVACALLLLTFDAVLLLRERPKADEHWLVSMPEVEASQRHNPDNWLFSSDGGDPRIPFASLNPGVFTGRGSMFLDLMACGSKAVEIEWLTEPGRQMPVRFRISAPAGSDVPRCVQRTLPKGYVIEPVGAEAE